MRRSVPDARSSIHDSPLHPGRFQLICAQCGLRVDELTFAEVCRRQDDHDLSHASAAIGLPQ